jgi:hypothetical protein
MPGSLPIEAGRDAENTRSAELVEELHKVGLLSAKFEKHFRVRRADGRMVPSKPDITITNGGLHVLSAKWGEKKELEAVNSADEYRANLEPQLRREGRVIGEVLAVTFPAVKSEDFIVHLRPREGRPDLCFRPKTLQELAQRILSIIQGRVSEIERIQEPVFEEARRFLHLGTQAISDAIRGVPDTLLEEVWGGHDFFRSLLLPKLTGEQRKHALRSGAGYLFVNQVLFYCLLAEAAQEAGGELAKKYVRVRPEDSDSPLRLREDYFERVHAKDYEPIYALNIAQFLTTESAKSACQDVVRSFAGLAPKLTVPDLIGQVFQEFIDPKMRKKLGACYTNPKAAALLAELSVPAWGSSILDPACGSGTLLVAAYRRKAALAHQPDQARLHHRFLERDITGIEAMGFAAHLAAVNLALQRPLVDTDWVRIAVADSTSKRPDTDVHPWDVSAPREFRQQRLDRVQGTAPTKPRPRMVVLTKRDARPIHLEKVDLVIMNPPFTSWHNMGETYRVSLKKSFSHERASFRSLVRGKFSQQGFFLMLAEVFVKDGGTIASVLPLSTFTTVAFSRLVDHLSKKFTLKTIVIGFARSAFSEVSQVTECLFVAEKRPPVAGHEVAFIGVQKHPDQWTADDIDRIAESCRSGKESKGLTTALRIAQADLISRRETVMGVFHQLHHEFGEARKLLGQVLSASPVRPRLWKELREAKSAEVHRWVLGSEGFAFYGPKALFIRRTEHRAEGSDDDRLVYDGMATGKVLLKDRIAGSEIGISPEFLAPALRSFSSLSSFDITDETDFAICKSVPELETLMRSFYPEAEVTRYLGRIREGGKEFVGGRWANRINEGSSRLSIGIRFNLTAPGTTVLSCRSEHPIFLAAYGFMVKGLSPREEKLFCLWTNSTLFLTLALEHITPTEGTWCHLQRSFVDRLPFPDFDDISEPTWDKLERLFDELGRENWPSLIEQLRGASVKVGLDDAMLELLGVSDRGRRTEIGGALRSGALATLEAFQGSMGR